MPKTKHKAFDTPKKEKKKLKAANKPPDTADEFLQAGVDYEEAGEKWRGGDAAKALRFFVRALDTYDAALARFPDSFDLVYNKARVQYDITQRPALYRLLPRPLLALLQEALQTHRRALALDPHDADLLFNTAQVLASIADAADGDDELAIGQIEEALTLFERCLAVQERQFAESQNFPMQGVDDDGQPEQDGGVPLGDVPSDAPPAGESKGEVDEPMQWASIVEPTTRSTLVETCVAALEALTALCPLVPTGNHSAPAQLDRLSQEWVRKTEFHVAGLEQGTLQDEARCATFKIRAAFNDVDYRFGQIGLGPYKARLTELCETAVAVANPTWSVLCSCADANIAFAAATADSAGAANTRWAKLTKALEYLGQATKLAGAQDLASIHAGRGDVEIFRHSLCLEGGLPENVNNANVRATLLKNAATYYRGAGAIAQSVTGQQDRVAALAVKQTVAECLTEGKSDAMMRLVQSGMSDVEIHATLRELVDEGIVSEATLRTCGLAEGLALQPFRQQNR